MLTFLSLTDIARYKNALEPKNVVANRMRLHNTIEYLWMREKLHNANFKGVEFDAFKKQAWFNSFTLSPSKWIEATHSIGIRTKSWRYGSWTFAHKDIAIKFANRISVEFELYLIKEFQRLKEKESNTSERSIRRLLTKMNYKIHTDSIQNHLVPAELTPYRNEWIC